MEEKSRPGPGARRRPWTALVVVAMLVAALFVAACGEDEEEPAAGGGGGTEETAAKPTGDPIITYTFADVNTQGPQFKNIHESARVYGEYINAKGGIKDRPVDVRLCDTKGTPTDATACARKAVADKAVAVVGSYNFAGDAIVPTLEKGNVAYFGMCCPISPKEYTSDASFPMGNQPLYSVGLIKRAKDDGCQRTNAVIIQGAESFKPIMETAAKKAGLAIGKYVSLPATARDYSPQVAEATSGDADCIVMIVSETPFIAFMAPFDQSGSKAKLYGPQGNLNEKVAKGHEQSTNGAVISGMYPDFTLPQWKDYRDSLEKYEADDEQDYNSLGGMGTWAAYEGFRTVVEGMGDTVDNQTFLEAAKTAKIDLPGIVPPLDFSKTWGDEGGPAAYARLEHRCAVFSTIENGKVKALTTEFEDLSELAGGTEPGNCG